MKTKNFLKVAFCALTLVTITSFMSCAQTIENASEHDLDIIHKYFTVSEQETLNQRLCYDGINSRAVLGQTNISYIPFYGYSCEVSLYESEIWDFYNKIPQDEKNRFGLAFDTIRDKVLIHELCHVLYPEDAHNSTWRKCFENHLQYYASDNNYCWEYFYNAYVASYAEGNGYEAYRSVLPLPN